MHRKYAAITLGLLLILGLSFAHSTLGAGGQTLSSQAASKKLTNSDVTQMAKAGLSPDVIVGKIDESQCNFDTSPAALGALKSAGVSNTVILAMVKRSSEPASGEAHPRSASSTQPDTSLVSSQHTDGDVEATSKPCIAVKPIGSHAFRNIMLIGVAGALISKQQYQVVDLVGYPARIGQKLHGNDLQTIQSNGTKVVILAKHYSGEDLHNACH